MQRCRGGSPRRGRRSQRSPLLTRSQRQLAQGMFRPVVWCLPEVEFRVVVPAPAADQGATSDQLRIAG